jgi:hypothetical protein
MAMNVDIDTRGLEPVDRTVTRLSPPVETVLRRNPYFISQLPSTAVTSTDAIVNFVTPGIPQQRITPPQPINMAGAGLNATPTASIAPVLIQTTPAPSIASALATIPTGYTFSFNQVRLPLSSTATINNYKVYRSATNNSATASVIRTIAHNPANVGLPVIVQDNQPNGVTEFYWVSAVNIQGVESNLTPAQSASVTSNAGFNSSSQVASSFHLVPSVPSFIPLSSSVLSNDSAHTVITVAASTLQFGSGTVSYNSGSVDPTLFGTYYIFADDPLFQGGAVTYIFGTLPGFQVLSDVRIPFGKIITSATAARTGGGYSGGSTASVAPPTAGAAGRGITF